MRMTAAQSEIARQIIEAGGYLPMPDSIHAVYEMATRLLRPQADELAQLREDITRTSLVVQAYASVANKLSGIEKKEFDLAVFELTNLRIRYRKVITQTEDKDAYRSAVADVAALAREMAAKRPGTLSCDMLNQLANDAEAGFAAGAADRAKANQVKGQDS